MNLEALERELLSAKTWLSCGAEELEKFRFDLLALAPEEVSHRYTSNFTERMMREQANKLDMIVLGMRVAQKP